MNSARLGNVGIAAWIAAEHDAMFGKRVARVTPDAPRRDWQTEDLDRHVDDRWFEQMREHEAEREKVGAIKQQQSETKRLRDIQDALTDDQRTRLLEHRGGCKCANRPPCHACSSAITAEEAEMLAEEAEPVSNAPATPKFKVGDRVRYKAPSIMGDEPLTLLRPYQTTISLYAGKPAWEFDSGGWDLEERLELIPSAPPVGEWVEHVGESCPEHVKGRRMSVRTRCGHEYTNLRPENILWSQRFGIASVVAYRVLP